MHLRADNTLWYLKYPTALWLVLIIIFDSPAQQTFLDSLSDKLQQRELKDSTFNFFLIRSPSLSEQTRDSAFRLLKANLNELRPETRFNFTLALSQSGTPHDPLDIWEECIHRIEAERQRDTLYWTRSLNYCAGALHAQNKISEAKAQYLKIIGILPPDRIDEELAVAHNNLGAILNNLNDPGGALPNYLRARDIFMQLIGDEHVYIAVINNNIGQVYYQLGRYDEQVEVQERARDIYLKTVGRNHRMTGNVFLNLGIAYKVMGFREKSLSAFNESLAIREQLQETDGIVAAMSEVAQLKATFPEHYSRDEIIREQRAVIAKGAALFDSNHISLVSTYNNYSLQLLDIGRIPEALRIIQKAIEIRYQLAGANSVGGGRKESTISDLPTLQQIGEPAFHDVKMFENKAFVLHEMYELTKNHQFLHASLRTYLLGDSLIETLKSQLLNGASRKQLIEEASDYYINAARTAMELHYFWSSRMFTGVPRVRDVLPSERRENTPKAGIYLNQAFNFTEKSRNWELIDRYMQTARNADIAQNAALQNISTLRSQLPNIFDDTTSPATDSLNRLIDVQLEELKGRYPEYFRFLYHSRIAPLDSIMAFCRKNTVQWLHYMNLGHGNFATILCTPDTISVSDPERSDSLDVHRILLMDKISMRDWGFTVNAYALYQLLFAAHQNFLNPGVLYVSSAGYLDNIPLDILLPAEMKDSMTEKIVDHYLLQKYTIALVPSGTFGLVAWQPNQEIRSSVFIAPEYLQRSLQYSGAEAMEGSKIISGKLHTDRITTDRLLTWLDNADLFHFAGHSFAHSSELDSIFLVLNEDNDTLYLNTLLRAQSNAHLAILSSCHSATGRSSQEGNIGLAYGFAFAGTPQVISSLWSVSDRETKQLFGSFYRIFRDGTNSLESLRQAKLAYLKESPVPGQHPYFWANWVYYGHPVVYERRGFSWWWIGGVLILIGVFVLVWRGRG